MASSPGNGPDLFNHLVKGDEAAGAKRKVVSNNTVLNSSLESCLSDVLGHLLPALLLVLADFDPELLDAVNDLVQVAKIEVEDLL